MSHLAGGCAAAGSRGYGRIWHPRQYISSRGRRRRLGEQVGYPRPRVLDRAQTLVIFEQEQSKLRERSAFSVRQVRVINCRDNPCTEIAKIDSAIEESSKLVERL